MKCFLTAFIFSSYAWHTNYVVPVVSHFSHSPYKRIHTTTTYLHLSCPLCRIKFRIFVLTNSKPPSTIVMHSAQRCTAFLHDSIRTRTMPVLIIILNVICIMYDAYDKCKESRGFYAFIASSKQNAHRDPHEYYEHDTRGALFIYYLCLYCCLVYYFNWNIIRVTVGLEITTTNEGIGWLNFLGSFHLLAVRFSEQFKLKLRLDRYPSS